MRFRKKMGKIRGKKMRGERGSLKKIERGGKAFKKINEKDHT